MPVQCRILGSPLLGRARDTLPLRARDISRAKGTADRADGLVIEFERANVVEDILTEARGSRIGLMALHECAMPRAGSASTRAESLFVDEELFIVLAALICLHLF